MIRRSKLLISMVFMAMVFMVGVTKTLAKPGDLKWKYPVHGDDAQVVVDSEGNRILVSNSMGATGPYWMIVSLDKNGKLNWQKAYYGLYKQAISSSDVAVDQENNIIVVGSDYNGTSFNWTIVSYAPSGEINWEKSYGGGEGNDYPRSVTVDSKGNVIVVGMTKSGSAYDWKIISYSSSGVVNWQDQYGDSGNDEPKRVAVDSKDNVIVVGTETKGSNEGWKIISYSSSGSINWQASYDSGYSFDYVNDLAIDSKDNVIVVGREGRSNFPGWKIISYSSSGATNWEESYHKEQGIDEAVAVAVDSQDNVVVGGYDFNGNDEDWKVISYSSSGGVNWQSSYDSGLGDEGVLDIAVDCKGNYIVVGYEYNGNDADWRIVSYSPAGAVQWQASYDSSDGSYSTSAYDRVGKVATGPYDMCDEVTIDKSFGDIVAAGRVRGMEDVLLADIEGYPPASHVLRPAEVRTVQPAAETPDPYTGTYLGFGDVVANGTHFRVEAAFPQYLKQSDNSTLAVKIFIAAQLPDDYSRLAFFDSSNNLKFQPPETLSSWKPSVKGEVSGTTVFPEIDVTSSLASIPSGTHYWYTLVVPDTVPDDFAGVDWSITPWEITVNVFEVK